MAQPLYFLPDLRQAAAESVPLRKQVLKERGLADIFADVPFDQQPLWELKGRGPGDQPGCILYYQTPSGAIPRAAEFRPKEQTWHPVGDGSLLWIGLDSAEPPKPEEMARRKQYPGYWIELGDGCEWRVPVIRRPDGTTELPRDMKWDATGKLVEPIKAAYEAYWDATAETAKWFYSRNGEVIDRDRALSLAVQAMGLNYRYGRNEHNVLRLVDSENYLLILAATVDRPAHEENEDQKKSETLNSPHGLQDESQTTDQAAVT